jgi:hypothetical protein
MRKSAFAVGSLIVIAVVLLAASASAQTINFGANLGYFTYTTSSKQQQCDAELGNIVSYTNFKYVSAQGASQPIQGTLVYRAFSGRDPRCPRSGSTATYSGSGYTIVMTTPPGPPAGCFCAVISVPGYLNPKYTVVGLIYAPPGHSSTVDYLNSSLVSSTVTTKNSYLSQYKEGTAVTISKSIFGYKNASLDSSSKASSSYTQSTTTTDSTAITVQKTTSTDVSVPGPACDYCGVDHDYDLLVVWLNPVRLYTLTNGGVVQPNGYGFSTFDQPGLDVYYVYAGELNGDIPMRTSTTSAFARAWAGSNNGFQYASGDGPALTTEDQQNILKLDPYFNCTYKSPVNDAVDCLEPPDSTRFTLSTNTNFPYQQPIPGGQPIQKTYQWSYTNTDTQGVDVAVTDTETYALETAFSGKVFGYGYQVTHSQEWTNSFTYETSSEFTSSNTSTATASITGPICNDAGGVCSPQYPPANAYNPFTCTALSLATSFGQGDSMYIYQDNLFGTFLLEPYGQ